MRVMIFFDLPTHTKSALREYRRFRKEIIRLGFMMMQESVYVKLVLNASVEDLIIDKVEKIKPDKGLIQILSVTEKQYLNMKTIVGEVKSQTLDTDERMVIL